MSKNLFLYSKNNKIEIFKLIWDSETYSIFVNWKCQTSLIVKETFENLLNWLNIQNEINQLENIAWVNIFKELNDKFYKENTKIKEIKWYTNILTKEMEEIIPFLENLKNNYFLVWWTAIALQLWHRESIDFDLFSNNNPLDENTLKNNLKNYSFEYGNNSKWDFLISKERYDFWINNVDVTIMDSSINFNPTIFTYIPYNTLVENFPLLMPDLVTLWWMKLLAMSFRDKNKDLFDLYFIYKSWISIKDMFQKMYEIYWQTVNIWHLLGACDIKDHSEEYLSSYEKINWKISEKEIPSFWEIKDFFKNVVKKEILEIYRKDFSIYKNIYTENFDDWEGLFDNLKSKFLKFK
jgi:hypothetical protein